MLSVVVASGSPFIRHHLARLVQAADAVVVGAACTAEQMVKDVVAKRPSLLVLDMQTPGFGLSSIDALIECRALPSTVPLTTLDQDIVCAFEAHRVDYLLKPSHTWRVADALAASRTGSARDDERRTAFRTAVADIGNAHEARSGSRYRAHVAVKVGGAIQLVRTSDVDRWETADNYLRVHVDATCHLIRMTLRALEPQLDPNVFARIHRRCIVQLDRVAAVLPFPSGDAVVTMEDGARLRVSRLYHADFRARLRARRCET